MSRKEKFLLGAGLAIVSLTAVALVYFKSNQHLGEPGVKSLAIEGSMRREIQLPQSVPGYSVSNRQIEQIVLDALPEDTSYAQAIYRDGLGQQALVSVVMMGSDRTSIHKPDFCLAGQGWAIDETRSSQETVSFKRPYSTDLPVMKVVASRTFESDGEKTDLSGVYVYWFVADKSCTESHWQRMWWMAKHLVQTGELQRWAYVSYFMPCAPGQEDLAFERVKLLMRASLPEFQLAWPPDAK